MGDLLFNEERHEYVLDGKVLPSVTTILPKQDFHCTPEQLERARIQGIEYHSKIKMYLDTRDTFGDPFLNDFKRVLTEIEPYVGTPLSWEHPLASKKYGFAGTYDIVCESGLVDFKRSRGNPRHHALQLSGYNLLLKENKLTPSNQWIVICRSDTGLAWLPVYNPQAESIFITLVKKWYMEREIESYYKTI